MLVAAPTHWPGVATMIGHPELLTDPRFADAAGFVKNAAALAELLDSAFRSQPFAHWEELLDRERITYSLIQTPEEAARDPQLRANDIVVPLDGVSDLDYIVSSPITLRGVAKVSASRAPELGEHTDEVLAELGFSSEDIRQLGAEGAIPGAPRVEAAR
jgi:formyl-CoA transferase